LIISRHHRSSLIITTKSAVVGWQGIFDEPILVNSGLDRLANEIYQIVIEGDSYRQRQSSQHRKEIVDTMT
jgi:DNA replication protein DnaC